MTIGVVVLSILIQGMTVSPLLRWLGLEARGTEEGSRGDAG
jgi:NhaP-type Na+/H+ or K+/H+ antiporter